MVDTISGYNIDGFALVSPEDGVGLEKIQFRVIKDAAEGVWDGHIDGDSLDVDISVPENFSGMDRVSLLKKYKQIIQRHMIDVSTGEISLYTPNEVQQIARPYAAMITQAHDLENLKNSGIRKAKQWEYDRWCYNNPDERYVGQEGYIDMNALVWESWLTYKQSQ